MSRRAPPQGHRPLPVLCALALLGAPHLVQAQPEQGRPVSAFERGPTPDQIALDVTPIPTGMGAIFVPSLTDPALEPEVQVRLGEQRVAWARTGGRIVLPPGEYEVSLGDGPEATRATTKVKVIAGITTPTAPFYGALRVTAVDRDGRPIDLAYTLRTPAGVQIGEGVTTEKADYRASRTWVAKPGAVEVVYGGSGKDTESVAVMLPAGEVARYRLVFEQDHLVRAEIAERELVPEERWWRARWVIGGDAAFSRSSGRLGSYNGNFLRVGLRTNAQVGIDTGPHLALLSLDLHESWLGLKGPADGNFATQKFEDELRAEVLYNFRPARIAGPYVRAELATALFPTRFAVTRDMRFEERRDGELVRQGTVTTGDNLNLFDRFSPLSLRAGAGLGLTAIDNRYFTVMARGGMGVRRATYDGGRFIESVKGDTLRLVKVDDDESWGAEARIEASVRASRALRVTLFGDGYVPEAQLAGDDDLNPILRLSGQAALAINPFLSLVYEVSLRREAYEISDLQYSDNLSLRVLHSLF